MTREATLLAKHEDLKGCLEKRNSLLLELYRSTAVLAKIRKHPSYVAIQLDDDAPREQSFLDVNDLSIGRFFHPSTLPPLSPKFPHNYHPQQSRHASSVGSAAKPLAPSIASVEQSQIPTPPTVDTNVVVSSSALNRSASPVPFGTDRASSSVTEHGTLNASKDEDGTVAAKTAKGAYTTESANAAVQDKVQTVKPLDDLPLTADDAEKLPEPLLKQHVAENKPDGARTVHLPPREQQEQRLKDLESHQPLGGSGPADDHISGETLKWHRDRRLSPPRSDHQGDSNVYYPTFSPRDQAPDRGVLGSQMEIARSDTATGYSPFTPNEQIRLEEARSSREAITDTRSVSLAAEAVPSDPESDQAKDDSSVIPQVPGMEFRPMDSSRREQQQIDAASEKSALRNYTHPGEVAKNITLSQRPPMRIDTGLLQSVDSTLPRLKKPLENGSGITHTPPDSATSAKATQTSSQAQSPPERMTTRVSSGVLRHKPVSEILGETRKPASPQADRAAHERISIDANRDIIGVQSRRTSLSTTTPDSAAFRLRLNELKGKDKSKLSTVVFARKQPSQLIRHPDNLNLQGSEVPEAKLKNQEYFLPLFSAQSATPPQSQLLNRLLGSASKTLTTANHYVDFHEQQDCRILTKIQHLQASNRWSFRQLERSVEPDRPIVHWDVLLGQMKWLRTDFREERKWKIAAADSMARCCAQWVAGSKQERAALQVKVRSPPPILTAPPDSAPTPDLIHSAEDDSSDAAEDEVYNVEGFQGNAPAAIFSMTPDMFYFGLEKTPITEKLLQELPLYQPSVDVQQAVLRQSHLKADKEWKASLLPVSKFIEGKLTSHDQGPPRKRSRYHYADLDEDNSLTSLAAPDLHDSVPDIRPAQDDVALFNPDNKHIRDRIHAGHAFRPPSDHPMPSQSFFESRQSSQWTQGEDDELRRLVREYAYNWSLVSSCLSMPSAFSAGTERRTPWECFERWIGLEGLPAEMAKTHYFRAYHGRLQAAQTTHEAQQQAVQQQQGNNAPHLPLRRRSTQPFLVERRKNTKHVHLVNAIRNLARKREATTKKQEEVAELAAIRKATQSVQPRHTMHTPQEFSRLRYENDLKRQEQAKAYRMQVLQQQQKAHAAQRAAMQINQHPNGTSLIQHGRSNLQASANGIGPTNVPVNGQVQANPGGQPRAAPMPRPSNGAQSNNAFHNQPGIPHAPMQPTAMPGSARLPPQMGPENLRIFQEANRVQAEQQRFLLQQRQQQQQHPHTNGQTSPNVSNSNFMPSSGPSGHGAFQGGSASPSMNGQATANGASSSPRMTNPPQPQALSSGMMPTINQIMSQLQARNPNATQEQIGQMATERLKQYTTHSHAHAAMQAAAGTGGSSSTNVLNGAGMSNNAMNSNLMGNLPAGSHQQPATAIMNGSPAVSTQQYAHMIRNQQQHQQNRSSGTPFSGPRPSSRSGTPQIHRTPSAQGGHPSASPVPSQAQVVGGQ
ncbi:MAG: hypothetical protein L6R42_001077 [Xanthoria sp. 1 TBL-2021]|nr:MAG: hypothetical protein L6R42_001077 [Xanthoria sp. 1 TBL-2021]